MEQEPKDITDRKIYETLIGSVCMSKTEYAMYQEEMAKRIGNLHIYVDADACPVVGIVEREETVELYCGRNIAYARLEFKTR